MTEHRHSAPTPADISTSGVLTLPNRIGLIGDCHGAAPHAKRPIGPLVAAGAQAIIYLGDWGFIWDPYETAKERRDLKALQREADRRGIVQLVLLGNHENADRIEVLPADSAGVRWVRKRIGILPRAFRARTESGATIAGLFGAGSPDRERRTPGRTWWPEEVATQEEVESLGQDPVDVLLGHDCPSTPELRAKLPQGVFSAVGLAYADNAQAMFQRAVDQTIPRMTVGGHYHFRLDVPQARHVTDHPAMPDDRRTFRAVTLNSDGKPGHAALLDLTEPDNPTLDWITTS